MDTALPQNQLEEMLDEAVRKVTDETCGVRLFQSGEDLTGELCTVHISFKNGFRTSLSFCADIALLTRLASSAMGGMEVTAEDVEDFGKEYFNILCGRIAAVLFQHTKVAARFSIPSFYRSRYEPENTQTQFVLTYRDDQHSGAQLIHHIQRPDENQAAAQAT